MKYFTKEWCFGEMTDEQCDATLNRYKKYIDQIYISLPFVLKVLAKNTPFHDGIVNSIEIQEDNLTLIGIFGDLEIGYFKLKIVYKKTNIETNNRSFFSIFNKELLEILSDEIEILPDGYYSHKLLFSSKKEFEITFKDVEIEIANVNSETYQKKKKCKVFFN